LQIIATNREPHRLGTSGSCGSIAAMAGANFLDQRIRKVLRTSPGPNATSLTGAGLRYKLSGRNAHGLPAAKKLVANRSGRSRLSCELQGRSRRPVFLRGKLAASLTVFLFLDAAVRGEIHRKAAEPVSAFVVLTGYCCEAGAAMRFRCCSQRRTTRIIGGKDR